MRVAIDTTGVQVTQAGTTTYTNALLHALRELPGSPEMVEVACRQRFSRNHRLLRKADTLNRELFWLKDQLPRVLQQQSVDLVHCPTPHVPSRTRIPVVATVHDLYVFHNPQAFPVWHRRANIHFLKETIRRADHIMTISDYTRNDLLSRFGSHLESRVHLAYEAADESFLPPSSERKNDVRSRYKLPDSYLLSVATLEPRKNLDRLLDAFIRIADTIPHSLVLTGAQGWKTEHLQDKVKHSGFADRIQFLGHANFSDLPCLYAQAEVFCFPSLFEGFGLPILEAMACGCPVLTSNVSSMPEIAGDASALVNPLDVEEIGATLLALLQDEAWRSRLRVQGLERAKQFSWKTCADQTMAVYEKALG